MSRPKGVRYWPSGAPPAEIAKRPEIQAGLSMVREGASLRDAQAATGATLAALKSACIQAGIPWRVSATKQSAEDQRRWRAMRQQKRLDRIKSMFESNCSMADIAKAVKLSPRVVQQKLAGLGLIPPPNTAAFEAARYWLSRRERMLRPTIAQAALAHGVTAEMVSHALSSIRAKQRAKEKH